MGAQSLDLFGAEVPVPVGSRWKNVHTKEAMQVLAIEDSMSAPGELRRYQYDQSQFFHRVFVETECFDNIERRFVRLDGASHEEVEAAIKERLATRKNRDEMGYDGPGYWATNACGIAIKKLAERRLMIVSHDEWNDLRLLMLNRAEVAHLKAAVAGQYEDILRLHKLNSIYYDEASAAGEWASNRECPSCRRARGGALTGHDIDQVKREFEAIVERQEKPDAIVSGARQEKPGP